MRLELPTPIHAACLIPSAIHAKWHAHQYANPEMSKAGLIPTSREGIWLVMAEQILHEFNIKLTNEDKKALVDIFSVLRRIYKSADSAWDQSQEIRNYICKDPLARATNILEWEHDGFKQITDLPLTINYLEAVLPKYFYDQPNKTDQIIEHTDDFIKDAVWGLVDSEKLSKKKRLDFNDRFHTYQQTTGRVGKTIARITGTIVNADESMIARMETIWEKASLASQIVDDMRDCPEDLFDNKSLSVVKYLLGIHREFDKVTCFAREKGPQISYNKLKDLAPRTVQQLDAFINDYINDLPSSIKNFLKHFYYGLGEKDVSHNDPFNRVVHTDPETHELLRNYVVENRKYTPHKLVDYCEFVQRKERGQLVMLVDPEKQSPEEAGIRVKVFFNQEGGIVFIGGSQVDNIDVFQQTVAMLSNAAQKFKPPKTVVIFPGNLDQIPEKAQGIAGVLNYTDIIGASNSPTKFNSVYPPETRRLVKKILKEKGLRSISTAYFLCGDCSTTKKTGIIPINLTEPQNIDYLYRQVERLLRSGVACIYLEGGSGAENPIPVDVAIHIRYLIDQLSPQTLLIVGGGIKTQQQIHDFSPQSHLVVIGNHLEKIPMENLAEEIDKMRTALK